MAIAGSTAQQIIAPVAHSFNQQTEAFAERNFVLDTVRGFAVLGILLRNIFVFGMPSSAYAMPLIWGDSPFANMFTWAFSETFVDGTMRAMFSMLFGASALLILRAPADNASCSPVDRYYRRLMWLMGLGLVHGYLFLWPYDVLFLYGLLGLMIFPLRNLSAKSLIVIATCLVVVSMLGTTLAGGMFDRPSSEVTQNMQKSANAPVLVSNSIEQLEGGPSDDEILKTVLQDWQNEYLIRTGGYFQNLMETLPLTFEQQSTEVFKVHVVDIGALMLIGMALLKLGVFTGERSRAFYVKMLTFSYGTGLTLGLLDICSTLDWGPSFLQNDSWPLVTYDVGRITMALGHVAAIVLVVKSGKFQALTSLFADAGQMALTNYLAQTVICATLFFGFGFSLFAMFEHYQLLFMALIIGAAQLFVSAFCIRFFGTGPAERLMKMLIYSRRQRYSSNFAPKPATRI